MAIMRPSTRVLGACTLACIALPLGFFGCAREVTAERAKTERGQNAQALGNREILVKWGEGADELSFHAGGDESHNRGPDGLAFTRDGVGFYVLDSLAHRIVEVREQHVLPHIAGLARDADGFAVSPRGEIAVHRAISAQVDVYDGRGQMSGAVPIPIGARDAIYVHVLSQGRVMLEHPFQERYLLGSPNMPREPELIVPTRREGVSDDFSKIGYEVVVRDPNEAPATEVGRGIPGAKAHAFLIEAAPVGEPEHGALQYQHTDVLDLGLATSARIFGIAGGNACAVLEHVNLEAAVVEVQREIVCASLSARKEVMRFAIDTSTVYTPRQELAFNGKQIAQALPTVEGLKLRTFDLAEVSK